jgi:hypothetical protein
MIWLIVWESNVDINLITSLINIYRVVFYRKNSNSNINIISFGENSHREVYCGCTYHFHAEMEAVTRLPKLPKGKKKVIDIIVIRVDSNYNLKNSKPCAKCMEYLNNVNQRGHYKINKVYYSNENGLIVMEKFNKMYQIGNYRCSKRFN